MKNRATFKIFKSDKDDQWYWNLTAPNNKVILASEGYKTRFGALWGTLSVRKNTIFGKRFEVRKGVNKQWFFTLVAGNGEVIGKSEGYKTIAARKNGVASVLENAPTAATKFVS